MKFFEGYRKGKIWIRSQMGSSELILITPFSSINLNNQTIKQWDPLKTYPYEDLTISEHGYLIIERNSIIQT